MRILHIIDSLGRGGAETLLVTVINNLPDFDHHVISLSENTTLSTDITTSCQITKLNFKTKLDTWRSTRFIRKYIQQNEIQVVHSHLVMANIISRLATPRTVPLFNSLHSLNGSRLFSRKFSWQRVVEKLTYKKRHHLIAVSKTVLNDYNEFVGVKGEATVLYNFVDDRFFADKPKMDQPTNQLRLVAVGSLKEQKNFEFVIDAFPGLPKIVSMDIYGDGPLKNLLLKRIEEHSVPVALKGVRTDIYDVLPQYDLFVMSSNIEGHPVALLEAMACGMPTIVSKIPVLIEATGGKGLYFSLANSDEFLELIGKIIEGNINLSDYASHNLSHANKIARKSMYLSTLTQLYKSAMDATIYHGHE